MSTRHKNYEMIVAWAEGKEVEWKPAGIDGAYDEWADVPSTSVFDEYNVFRIKPKQEKTVGYRRYIMKCVQPCQTVYRVCIHQQGARVQPEGDDAFVQWIDTEWQYYTITGEG